MFWSSSSSGASASLTPRRGRPAEGPVGPEVGAGIAHGLGLGRCGGAAGGERGGDQQQSAEDVAAAARLIRYFEAGDDVVDGVDDGLVGQVGAPALRRHVAGLALVALQRMRVQRVHPLRDARRPRGLVAELRCAGDARAVAGHAGLVVDGLAGQVRHRGDGLGETAAPARNCPRRPPRRARPARSAPRVPAGTLRRPRGWRSWCVPR